MDQRRIPDCSGPGDAADGLPKYRGASTRIQPSGGLVSAEEPTDEPTFVPRHLVTLEGEPDRALPFDTEVDQVITGATRAREPRRFQATIVGCEPGDGISTLAAAAVDAAERASMPTTWIRGVGTTQDVRQLLDVFKLKTVVGRAREVELISTARWINKPRAVLSIVAIILVAGVAAFLDALSDAFTAALSAAMAAVVVAAAGLIRHALQQSNESNRIKLSDLVQAISDENVREQSEELMRLLALEYGAMLKPRCMVIDDYSRAHALVRLFVDYYLADEIPKNDRGDVWFVFDRHGAGQHGKLWRDAVAVRTRRHTQQRLHRTRIFALRPLTAAERRALAELVGHPERASYVTAKAVCVGYDPDSIIPFVDEIDRLMESGQHHLVATLYLLAVTALYGANPRWEPGFLRDLLTRQLKPRRAQVLSVLFGGVDPKQRDSGLTALTERLDPSYLGIGPEPIDSVYLRADVARCLIDNAPRWNLPEPGVAHLYWALYWNDIGKRRLSDVVYVDKSAKHALRATLPRHIDSLAAVADELTQQLFQVSLTAIEEGLACCCVSDTRELIRRAVELTGEDRADGARKRRLRLRRLAWDAYAVLGDDQILTAILSLESMLADRQLSPTEHVSSARSLYFASLGKPEPAIIRPPSGRSSAASGALTEPHLRFNGGWLALSASRYVRGAQGPLKKAALEGVGILPRDIADVLRAEEDRCAEWDALDCVTMVLGLWCWLLRLHPDAARLDAHADPDLALLADTLEGLWYAISDFADAAAAQAARRNSSAFVAEGLEQDLVLTIIAVCVIVTQFWQRELTEKTHSDIFKLLYESVTRVGLFPDLSDQTLPSPKEIVGSVVDRMGLLQGAWRSLGFDQLASHLVLRRVQLAALFDIEKPTEGKTASMLAQEFGRTDRRALLARLIAARGESDAESLEAIHLRAAALVAMSGSPDDNLGAELCRIAVEVGNTFQLDWAELLDFIFAEDSAGEVPRLEAIFDQAADSEVRTVAERYFNVLSDEEDGTRWTVLERTLRRRAAKLDEDARSNVELTIDHQRIQREIFRGRSVPIDAVLERWHEHRGKGSYAHLLYLLCGQDGASSSATLVAEVEAVARGYREHLTSTGILLLLWRLTRADWLPSPLRSWIDSAEGVAALRECVHRYDRQLPPTRNFDIYAHLKIREADSENRGDAAERVNYWIRKMIEFDEAQKLSVLLDAGRFALLFRYWWRVLAAYGLTLFDDADTQAATTAAALLERAQGDHRGIRRAAGRTAVSRQFLADIAMAFESDLDVDDDLREARRLLEQQARESLPQLFDALKQLDDVPPVIRSIVAKHHSLVLERIRAADGLVMRA